MTDRRLPPHLQKKYQGQQQWQQQGVPQQQNPQLNQQSDYQQNQNYQYNQNYQQSQGIQQQPIQQQPIQQQPIQQQPNPQIPQMPQINQNPNQYQQQPPSQYQQQPPSQYQQQPPNQYQQQNPNQYQQQQQKVQKAQQQSSNQQQGKKQSNSKLDNEQIPRPVTSKEQSVNVSTIETNNITSIPLAHQQFIQNQHLQAGPRYLRSSLNQLSNEYKNIKTHSIQFGLTIQPFADQNEFEEEVQLVQNSNDSMLLRCSRCKTYVNGYWQFNYNQTAQCNICKFNNQINSTKYNDDLNSIINNSSDKFIELQKGVYDLECNSQYVNKSIQNYKNYIVFCIEMSVYSVGQNIFQSALNQLNRLVENDMMHAQQYTEIAIITFNNRIQMYNIPNDLSKEINIIELGDIDEQCICLSKEQMFMNAGSQKQQIQYLIEKLLKIAEPLQQQYNEFVATNPYDSLKSACNAMGSALLNSVHSIAPNCGRVLLFTSQTTNIGYKKITPREVNKVANTDKEKTLYVKTNLYEELISFAVQQRIGVDIFYFQQFQYQDIQNIMQICNSTGGQFYMLTETNKQINLYKLENEMQRNLLRNTVYDVVMTVRSSNGIVLQEYYNSDGKQLCRDLESSIWSSDKQISIIFKQEDNISEQHAYIQYALLYTSSFGKRIVRIINHQYTMTTDIVQMYRSIDVDCLTKLLILQNADQLSQKNQNDLKQQIQQTLATIFYHYRTNCVPSTNPGKLVFPDSLKLLPLYLQSFLKQQMFFQNVSPDNRVFDQHYFGYHGVYNQAQRLFPKVHPIHRLMEDEELGEYDGDWVKMTQNLPLLFEKLDSDGIYLIDNAETIYILVCQNAECNLLQQMFGVDSLSKLQEVAHEGFPYIEESDLNQKVNNMINQVSRNKNSAFQDILIFTEQDSQYNNLIGQLLLEEKTKNQDNYIDFLCNLHTLIQQKLS